MSAAYRQAQSTAAMLRRCGYPEATAAREYCIDGEIGTDSFYTFTVSVYAGPYRPETIPSFLQIAMAKTKARLGFS